MFDVDCWNDLLTCDHRDQGRLFATCAPVIVHADQHVRYSEFFVHLFTQKQRDKGVNGTQDDRTERQQKLFSIQMKHTSSKQRAGHIDFGPIRFTIHIFNHHSTALCDEFGTLLVTVWIVYVQRTLIVHMKLDMTLSCVALVSLSSYLAELPAVNRCCSVGGLTRWRQVPPCPKALD